MNQNVDHSLPFTGERRPGAASARSSAKMSEVSSGKLNRNITKWAEGLDRSASGLPCARSALPGHPLLSLKTSVLPGPCFGICCWALPALLPARPCRAQSRPVPSSEQHLSSSSPGKALQCLQGCPGHPGPGREGGGSSRCRLDLAFWAPRWDRQPPAAPGGCISLPAAACEEGGWGGPSQPEPCPASCRALPEETKRLLNLEKPHFM